LSLTISSNEFEIIDYLNNGASGVKKRLVRQASLCLALALAESVQSLNKNDKTFLLMKALGPKILKVAVVLKRCNRFIKRIDCWNYFACC
jgi:hypothetical protein